MEKLFEEWERKLLSNDDGSVFIRDGIVDLDVWKNSEVKISFILKETNGTVNADHSLTEFLRNGGDANTWNNIARWTSVLLDGETISYVDFESRKEQLKRIAAINVKKTGGTNRANYNTVERHIQKYAEEIKRQLEMIQPTIIISCIGNLWFCFKEHLQIEVSDSIQSDFGNGHKLDCAFIELAHKKVPIFQYRHPNRCSVEKSQNDMFRIRGKFILRGENR